ncbi:MAG: sugar transferase [Anaerolineales bacterium]|nr:sugar transferase [Anaerolineales bacterium]
MRQKQATPHGAPVIGTLDDVWTVVSQSGWTRSSSPCPCAHQRLVGLIAALSRLPVRLTLCRTSSIWPFVKIDEFSGIPMIGLREPAIDGFTRLAKRTMDLMLATLGLVVIAPIMALIALAVKIDSPGPVIFKQQRIGENGRLFWMYKFRSMCQDAEMRQAEVITQTADGKVVHKQSGDPRVTRVGRLIRATSLDELPQLFNVLKGDMSLVGRARNAVARRPIRTVATQTVLRSPGITGWWQGHWAQQQTHAISHHGRPVLHPELFALARHSDFGRTIGAILKRKGAYQRADSCRVAGLLGTMTSHPKPPCHPLNPANP